MYVFHFHTVRANVKQMLPIPRNNNVLKSPGPLINNGELKAPYFAKYASMRARLVDCQSPEPVFAPARPTHFNAIKMVGKIHCCVIAQFLLGTERSQ